MNKLLLLLVVSVGLVGCATGPTLKNYTTSDAACIKGGMANFIKYYSDGEAHVSIQTIDDAATSMTSSNCFPPGKHHVGVSAAHVSRSVQGFIDYEFRASTNYQLEAHIHGNSFAFDLFDITSTPKKKVSEFALDVNSSVPVFIPIFIPR
jgi:hypothetical protein